MSNNNTINIETIVEKDLTQVWERYTSPDHIVNWNFASEDWCCPRAVNEVQEGGRINWRMEAKDGSMGFDFEGKYTLVTPHSQLKYIIADGRKVDVRFKAIEDQLTKVSIQFEPENMNSRELQQTGWQAILNNFKSYAEK